MPTFFYSSDKRPEIEKLIRDLPGILSGKVEDQFGICRGFKVRVAFAFFSIIKEQFIIKSRGGTDEAGIKWPRLSREYLAYQRPMGQNGQGSRKPPHAGKLAPGGKDGFMTAAQLKRWRAVYSSTLARLALQVEDLGEAKGRAAAIAWVDAKARGVKTKLDVFGSREVEILRDRGILFNSLSPGIINERKTDADYQPATPEQIFRDLPGALLIGTNVEYATYHQEGARPIWPKDGNLPQAWISEIFEVGVSGLVRIGELFK